MSDLWERAKAHPWIIGAVIGLVLFFFVLSGTGGGSSTASSSATGNATDNSLALAQLGAQAQMAGYAAAADASVNHDAASLEALKISSQSTDFANGLAAEVALSKVGATADVAKQSNTLQTQIAIGQQDTTKRLAEIQSNTTIQNTTLLTNALTSQAQISADTTRQLISGQTSVAQQQAQNARPRSWIESIFG